MQAIIICGLPAAGKTTVANIIARKLGLKVLGGGDILMELAIDQGYDAHGLSWWDSKEGIAFMKQREKDPEFDKEADKKLTEKINAGNVVITSYPAPWIAKKGYKVWLAASLENRAKRMSERDKSSLSACMKVAQIRDAENSKHYKAMYNIDFGNDLSPFNLVIDTNDKSPEQIADMIIDQIKKEK